ncbi:uncharacterized protein CANTADRAFT_69549 [Suhomyces tanzawaensis NRRL Y-17324]|uniref:RING-type domain-containing protein n=1 Tax=Suhomyces tanzawaensis NRRL Y-17324 TaxID=984487 RepID=A0A1E4SEZ1_9ASCO|nr:uncharacterized protein CANTADRAFT_69549 [Suhomyces tanzawaensis NRRL Y-17324]ODV78053.1 hypothetical protein CANTADRAFT_69549 [Suhomyces tanzawaensis NRRL Y-17324]
MNPISYPAPRVSQVDAHILDSELLSLLKEQLSSVFHLHSNSRWSYNQHPEFWSLLLNLVIFRETVWKKGSSYGLSLQNLKLTDLKSGKIIGKSKKSLLFLLLLGTYGFNKLQSYLYSIEDEPGYNEHGIVQRVRQALLKHKALILSKVDHTLKIVNLINFSLFLLNGKYPSITHRILGISLTPIVTDLLKFNGNNVNFEFQNRQLVWNVMTEFLVFTLPLLQLGKLKKMAMKILDRGSKKRTPENESVTQYTNLPVSQCAICHDINFRAALAGQKTFPSAGTVTNPYITNCGHIYCYVCIATRFNSIKTTGEELGCLRCNQKLEWFKEHNEDIDEDAILFEAQHIEVDSEEASPFVEEQDSASDSEEESEDESEEYEDGEDEAFDM